MMSKLDQFRGQQENRGQTPFGKISDEQLQALAALTQDAPVADEGGVEFLGVRLTDTGAEIPTGLDATSLQAVMRLASYLQGSLGWIIGDLILYAENRRYGDMREYAKVFGKAPKTIYNWVAVARAYPKSSRRRELSYKHHEVISGHPRRWDWLDEAIAQGWSAGQLRKKVYPPEIMDTSGKVFSRLNVRVMNLLRRGIDAKEMATKLREIADEIEKDG